MGLFSRSKEPPLEEEISSVLDVREAAPRPQPEPVPPAVLEPPRRPRHDVPIFVPWTGQPPHQAGLYWWRGPMSQGRPLLAVVLEFGGRLSVRARRGDACLWTGVSVLQRQWAGPLPLAEDMLLEDLEVAP